MVSRRWVWGTIGALATLDLLLALWLAQAWSDRHGSPHAPPVTAHT